MLLTGRLVEEIQVPSGLGEGFRGRCLVCGAEVTEVALVGIRDYDEMLPPGYARPESVAILWVGPCGHTTHDSDGYLYEVGRPALDVR